MNKSSKNPLKVLFLVCIMLFLNNFHNNIVDMHDMDLGPFLIIDMKANLNIFETINVSFFLPYFVQITKLNPSNIDSVTS